MQERIFDPLGMTRTTFDMRRALATNHASPHAHDVDNRVQPISMDFNYSVVPHRPAGGVWTSAHDLIRYIQLEANRGVLPDGTRLVSEKNLLIRRAPGVSTGEDSDYGMGLETGKVAGVQTMYHGGSMGGYKSDIYLLPASGVGAVLLTNDDDGWRLLQPFMRRLVEVVYGAKPQAVAEVEAGAARERDERARERPRLTLPADSARVARLAALYRSPQLGELAVRRKDGQAVFDFGEWQSAMATRIEPDGSVSFVSVTPGVDGFPFEPGERDGKRVLIVRDGQHEYVFTEVAG